MAAPDTCLQPCGGVYRCLLPEGTLSTGERTMRCVQLHGIALATLTAVVLVTLLAGISLIDLIAYSYRYYLPLLADLFTSGNLPGSDNTAPGFVMLLSGDVLALLTNLINALSLPLVVLMLFSRYAHGPAALPPTSRRALLVYISIATLALVLFLLIMHFMTQRYTTLLSLLLLSFVPLMLDRLYTQAQERGTLKRFMGIVSVFIFYYLIDSLFSFGYSQQHVEEGVAWTRENLPAEAQLRTNNFAIAYHSGRIPDYDLTVRAIVNVLQSSTSGDYLVLEIDHDDDASALDNTLLYLPLTNCARSMKSRRPSPTSAATKCVSISANRKHCDEQGGSENACASKPSPKAAAQRPPNGRQSSGSP